MSTESENLYTKNNQLIAQIYDNLSGENKSEEAISSKSQPYLTNRTGKNSWTIR